MNNLTKQEERISEMIAWGASKRDVARLLFISEHTVDKHVRNIYEKTGCSKINELSAWWFCKHFNISVSLSPLVSKIVSIVLLLIFTYGEIQETSQLTSPRTRIRAKTERVMNRARRSARDEYRIAN
jgi:DNA-binding CsgD family transcriptional regulator